MFTQFSQLRAPRFVTSNRKVVFSILAVVSLAAAISLSLRLAQSAPAGPPSPLALTVPTVTLDVPGEVLIGEDFEFEVKFKNPGGTVPGYAPYIDLYLPASGADKNDDGLKCDGITFVSAAAVFNSPPAVALPPAYDSNLGGTPPCPLSYGLHPFVNGSIGQPTVLTFPQQHQLVVLALPFGSFDPTQPEITVRVKAHLSDYADVATQGTPPTPPFPLTIHARGGFRYGTTAIAEPNDPVMESAPVSSMTTPTLFKLKKEYLGPENEAVSGPNFIPYYPLKYKLTADIAKDQEIHNFVLTDNLPPNLQFANNVQVSIQGNPANPVAACPAPGPFDVLITPPLTPLPGGTLSVTLCNKVKGSETMEDVVVKFDFYIPDVDANGPIINQDCLNAPVDVKNDILATGDWDPLDPRDPLPTGMPGDTVPVTSNLTNEDHILKAKCLAIQKSVQMFQEWPGGASGPTPGDILRYELKFQVSDYFTIGQLVVTDFLADGQALHSTPATFTVTDLFGTTGLPSTFPAVSVTTVPNSSVPLFCPASFQSPPMGTILRFDVSSAMSNLPSTFPRHSAGILTGGHAAGPATATPATGTIVFYAQINDAFNSPVVAPHDQLVDKHDPINNCVKIEGSVYQNVPRPTPDNAPLNIPTVILSNQATDTSAVQTFIVTDTLKKSVHAVKRNGAFICGETATTACLNFPATQEVRPGDEVTFRIEKTIPSSDAEDVTVEDWLPLPIFDVNDPAADGTTGWSFASSISSAPPPGTAGRLMPDHTLTVLPGFFAATATNSLQFNYGTFDSPANVKAKIDLLFTMTVTTDPFADNLFLTNEVRETEFNSFGTRFDQVAIAQVNLREPDLVVRKGVVATDNPNAAFTPPTGATFDLGGFVSGTVGSNNVSSIDSDVQNVDANDVVTFAITIENQGGHDAFDVLLEDKIPTSCFTLVPNTTQAKLGSGGPVSNAAFATTASGGFTFSAPGLAAHHPTDGSNIIVITFQVKLKADIQPGCCQNRAELQRYASVAGGPNFVTAGFNAPHFDLADVCTKPTLTKSVVATSEAHTGPETSLLGTPQVVIGEIVRYRLEVRLPEGSSPNLQITDSLPAGMRFLDGGTTRVAFVSNGAGITRSAVFNASFDVPGSAPPPSATLDALPPVPTVPPGAITGGAGCGDPVTFNLGNVQNFDDDDDLEYVVIEFNALVCNAGSNSEGDTLPNSFSVSVNNSTIIGSPAINVIVREPNLIIAKTVSPSTVVQGVTVPYTVTITNSSLVDAFDVQFADTLPVGLILDPASVNVAGCSSPTVVNTVPSVTCARIPVGGVVTVRYKALADPITCPVTLTNNARTTWTSLPGPNGTTTNSPPMSTTPGTSGAPEGERDGVTLPLSLNDYAAGASAALSVRCPPCVSAPAGIVDWWPFDEAGGTISKDIGGVVNNLGTHNNGPTPTSGKVGGALCFDGANDYIEVADHPEIDFPSSCPSGVDGAFTIDAWVRTSDSTGVDTILDKRVNPNRPVGYSLFLVDGRLGFQLADGGNAPGGICGTGNSFPCTNYVAPPTSANVASGDWHLVAVTVTKCPTPVGKMYVDGNLVLTFTPRTGDIDNSAALQIGRRDPAFSETHFNGCIDELEFFNRDLAESEIQAIYNARSSGKCKCPPITLNPAAGALPATLINSPYKLTFTAGGGCSSLFTFSVTSGSLPPGLTLSPSGVLSGTPTQTGIFTFTVTAMDSCGCTKSQTYTLSVDNCPMVPLRLFNTGVANDGSLLAAGAPDPHYALVNTGSDPPPVPPPAIVLAQNEIQAYVPNNAISQWIGPNVTPLGNSPVGFYTYRVTFDMPAGADLSTVITSGQWASDNEAVIVLNGQATAFTTGPADFGSFTPFAITGTANFLQNTNFLEFKVRNRGVGGGTSPTATGLRVEINGSVTCCPQPNKGTVIIRKNTVGGDNTFGYTTTGAGLSAFNITTSGGTQSQTFSNISPGAKTVTESSLPSGWFFNSLTCSDPDGGTTASGQTANIDLDAGETVMCTYTNTRCAITLNPAAGPLPEAALNTPYSQSFTATGGSCGAPTFSVTSGALPPGLTLGANGVLSGTATQTGDFSFTVTATDSCGCSQSETYTLKVNCFRPPGCPLVISRFRTNGPAGSADEFVEIFNSGDSPIDVSTCSNDPDHPSNGIGVFASAGNGTFSNLVSLACQIPGGTVIQGRSYFLCAGKDYSLGALGNNGGSSHSVPDQIIGSDNATIDDIPDDAGLALLDIGSNIINACPIGSLNCCSGFNYPGPIGSAAVYDKVGFQPYGPSSPMNVGTGYPGNIYPSLASQYCEGPCLQPVGDASTVTLTPGDVCPPAVGQSCVPAAFPVSPGGTIGNPGTSVCYGESGQYEFLRRQTTFSAIVGTLHQDTNDNPADFIIVSPNPTTGNVGQTITGISGVTSVLGAAGPHNLSAPPDIPGVALTQSPFDDCSSQLGPRNIERNYGQDFNIEDSCNDPLGTFIVRLRYTNITPNVINGVRFRVDDLSTLCGAQTSMTTASGRAQNVAASPNCGTGTLTAILKVVNSMKESIVNCQNVAQVVNGTVLEDLSITGGASLPAPGALSPFGGGIDNSLIVNPSFLPSSVGDGVTGGTGVFATVVGTAPGSDVLFIKIKFGVVRSGRFIVLITPEGR